MANQWFKFYGGEYLSDPKIERLTPVERSCWLTLLCMASMSNDGILEYLTKESLLNKSGVRFNPYDDTEWDNALLVLEKFQNLNMIEVSDNGNIIIKNWKKRQESYLTDAERARNYRDRKKIRHDFVTDHVTNVTLEENRIEENRIENTQGVFQKENIKIMYNYEAIDENGNPLKRKSLTRISKSENEFLISIGFLWRKMASEKLNIPENEVVMLKIYYAIRKAYDRDKFTKEQYTELFQYFFDDKGIKMEDKLSFDLCLSQKYIAKYKLKIRNRKFTNASLANSMSL